MNPIILASTSIYRRELFEKLGLAFTSIKPDYDEEKAKNQARHQKKTPREIAEILSRGKADSVCQQKKTQAVTVIAGDQLVDLDGEIIGKAPTENEALRQLQKMNGKTHTLITAVTLVTPAGTRHLNHLTRLKMKTLSDNELRRSILTDEPYDCAGSYKIEKSGITLFSKIEGDDFTAIQGLPLLWVSNQLQELGYEFFKK